MQKIISGIAIFSIGFLDSTHNSANFVSKAGGRLSIQKYPISSITFIACDFPAPDIPVTITNFIFPRS